VREACREPANGGQPLGSTGAAAFIRKTRARGIQCIHQPIELALASSRKFWKIGYGGWIATRDKEYAQAK
jgi:hypothetical protein